MYTQVFGPSIHGRFSGTLCEWGLPDENTYLSSESSSVVQDSSPLQKCHMVNQWRSQDFSVEGREGWGLLPGLSDFCNFSTKITHFYAYFSQNSYFKAMNHQLKAFEKQSNCIK